LFKKKGGFRNIAGKEGGELGELIFFRLVFERNQIE